MKFLNFSLYSAEPVRTTPNPPLSTSPQPVPPPLWRATQVAPRIAVPTKFCTLMSAQNMLPSRTDAVSRYGESAPETSWWSLERTIGPWMLPASICYEKRTIIKALATASAYRMRAFDPTTNLFSSACWIQPKLSAYCALSCSGQSCISC
jgi:hypothetical protein